MGSPYVGEIRLTGFNFAPVGWAFCDGSLLQIADNEVLFTLIGTTYGGDGITTFALPDLRGRIPIHVGTLSGGQTYSLGAAGGIESAPLTVAQIPPHNHPVQAGPYGNSDTPTGNYFAASATVNLYAPIAPPAISLNQGAIQSAGGSQPHENRPPYLAVNFIISLFGIFPSQ